MLNMEKAKVIMPRRAVIHYRYLLQPSVIVTWNTFTNALENLIMLWVILVQWITLASVCRISLHCQANVNI